MTLAFEFPISGRITSIGQQARAGDVAGFGTRKEGDEARDPIGIAISLEGCGGRGNALYVSATAAPSVASRLAIAAPMLREPPVTSATLSASFLVTFVLTYFLRFVSFFSTCRSVVNTLASMSRTAQYQIGCPAMLFRHNETQRWNSGICDIFWQSV